MNFFQGSYITLDIMLEVKKVTSLVSEKLENWINAVIKLLPNFVLAIIIIIAFYFLAKTARYGIRKLEDRFSENSAVMRLLGTFVFLGVFTAGLFISLSILQLDKTVTSLLAGAGIIGLALGFAFQETAANFLAGVLMAFRKPLRLGDIIETNEHFGTVIGLNLRAITVKTFQGQEVIIPNKNVLYNPIVNFSKSGQRRLDLEVGISYGDDLAKVKRITLEAVKQVEGYDHTKPVYLWYEGFGDSSINFTLAIWSVELGQAAFRSFKSDVVMAIKAAFDQNDITIPFPIRTLDFGIKGGQTLQEMQLQVHNGLERNSS